MFNNIETLVFQITTRCPFQCPQCYMQRGNADLPINIARNVMDAPFAENAKAVQLTGGEPVMYPQLDELINIASERGLYTVLATSGYGHSFERYDALKRSGLTAICISLNHHIKSQNLLSRDMFELGLTAMKQAQECGITCFCNTVVTDDNIDDLLPLAKLVRKHNVVGMNLLRPVPSYDGKYIPNLSKATIEQLRSIVAGNPEFFFVENCFMEYWKCNGKPINNCNDIGEKMVFVNSDGTFSPCSKQMFRRYKTIEDMAKDYKNWECGCNNS